ncbi:hypothetical protein ACET3Z_008806 [Daucus carota]
MASTSNLELAAPCSWDVFLSFCGRDTRRNFISHLYFALDQAGILTFRDDPALEKGEQISAALLSTIHASKMFVVVISENYARSSWCLDELVEILGFDRRENRVVPVFYYVDPSDLRHQNGIFGEALDYHEKLYSVDMIDKWRNALAAVAELSGYHLKKAANENESETIQEIVENIARNVSTKVLHLEKHLPGVDSVVEEVYHKLRMELNHVRAIGICGMGGLGKTTAAKAFYNKYSNIFDISCFIDKVKQYSQGGSPLLLLLEQVLIGILRRKDYKVTDVDSGFRQLKHILCFKKSLIVLDDLDQSSYSEFLVPLCNFFSAGSRIIVTTRDVKLLNQLRSDITDVDIYMLNKMEKVDSLELFSYHAFRTPTPPANLRGLSESFVGYCRGLPLALKVLGSSLHGRTHDVLFWKAKLEKIKEIPENEILEILRLSYDELDGNTEKAIFLDIAFFFVGKYKSDALEIFESCDFFPEVGITTLVERCLVVVDENNKFQMHDLIQDMGRELGKGTHLFWQGNTLRDFQNQEGIDKIEVLILDLTLSAKKLISSKIFEKLPRLRLLEIFNASGINGHFTNSFHELRSIYWSYCTWKRLPPSFKAKKLVSLHMPHSNFKILWKGAMPFKSLKTIDVKSSVKLKMTPNFRNSKLVEALNYFGCESLRKFHPSIRELTGLYVLVLGECTNLKEFPEPVGQLTIMDHLHLYSFVKQSAEPMKQWANMEYLYLGHCSNIRRLPEQLGDMKGLKVLDASYTAIEVLPDSITQLKELVRLKLSSCRKLVKLPEQIGNMKGLRTFIAGYSAIEQLPDSFVSLITLEILVLRYCQNLRNLPNDIWMLKKLKKLDLGSCSKLERLPDELGEMQLLEQLYASNTAIEQVPNSVELLTRLQVLSLAECKKLKYVPNCVWNLTSLKHLFLLRTDICRTDLPDAVKLTKLVGLSLNCDIRLQLPMILSFSSLERLILRDEGESSSPTRPFNLLKLDNLQYLELYNCSSFGSSFPELPLSLTHLSLCALYSCRTLGPLSSLKQLKKLYIFDCISLESLPLLPPHIQSLTVYDCRSLQDLPDMSVLKDLASLNFGGRVSYESVSLKQSFLQVRRHFLPMFNKGDVPKIAEWFTYKSNGRTLRFDIPSLRGDNFLGLALWVRFTSKNNSLFNIRGVVRNETNGTTNYCWIPAYSYIGAQAYSLVGCISRNEISIGSGDKIEISFKRQLYSFNDQTPVTVNYEEVKVEMCGARVIRKTPITPDFPSVLNNLIKFA